MTLNITVLSRRSIYQSADFRLTDARTGNHTVDFATQKIVMVNTFGWTASICFAGVGRTANVIVSEWLTERANSILNNDPFERLIEELRTADTWLSNVPPPLNRHSFNVGAFVGSEPIYVLISNFEHPSGQETALAAKELSVFQMKPTRPKALLSGIKSAVTKRERKDLVGIASTTTNYERVCDSLAEINRRASTRSNLISPGCFTTHLLNTGESEGRVHGLEGQSFFPTFGLPPGALEVVRDLLDAQIGGGNYQLVGMSGARTPSSEMEHQARLKERPNDPELHNNYGVFLGNKGNHEGAKREYTKAISLNPNHALALCNLANSRWNEGDLDGAEILYNRALSADAKNEASILNFAKFQAIARGLILDSIALLDTGIDYHPKAARLQLFRAELSIQAESATAAVEHFQRAREKGANQTAVETGYACALHMSGAPIADCVAAYRVALSLNPNNADLKLNLSQLLFLLNDREANQKLKEAIAQGLTGSAHLEGLFYQLCHTPGDKESVIKAIKVSLNEGSRLNWDVQPNIEEVRKYHPKLANQLDYVRQVMIGDASLDLLDGMTWPAKTQP